MGRIAVAAAAGAWAIPIAILVDRLVPDPYMVRSPIHFLLKSLFLFPFFFLFSFLGILLWYALQVFVLIPLWIRIPYPWIIAFLSFSGGVVGMQRRCLCQFLCEYGYLIAVLLLVFSFFLEFLECAIDGCANCSVKLFSLLGPGWDIPRTAGAEILWRGLAILGSHDHHSSGTVSLNSQTFWSASVFHRIGNEKPLLMFCFSFFRGVKMYRCWNVTLQLYFFDWHPHGNLVVLIWVISGDFVKL